MTKLYTVDALVIKGYDYGEADKILTLYTREQGKVQAIAKGVRKPTSRIRGGVQLFTHSRMLLYRGRTLDTVTQAESQEVFAGIREDLIRLTCASYISELLDAAVPDREPNQRIFILTLMCLGLLLGDDPELSIRLYEMRLLHLLGYRPSLTNCNVCHNSLEGSLFKLSAETGGLVCKNCSAEISGENWISAGTASILNKLLSIDLRQVFRLKVSRKSRMEMDFALKNYLEYYLERPMKSRVLLQSLLRS